MPMERSRRPSWSASRPHRCEGGRRGGRTGRGHRHESPHVESRGPRGAGPAPRHAGAAGTRCGRAGPSCRPAPGPWRPGAKRAIRSPSASRATLCQRPTSGASTATLFRCTAPRKCQTTASSTARRLRDELARIVLAQVTEPGLPRRRAPHRARTPWSRRRPVPVRGRRRRARCAAGPRPASARPRR